MSAHNPLSCEENFNYVVEVFASDSRVGEDSTFSKVPPACLPGSNVFWENQMLASFNTPF